MAFPLSLTSKLTGATPAQLHRWRAKRLVVPEVQPYKPPLYSFRDLILVRSVVYLRAKASLQKIDKAFQEIGRLDLAGSHYSELRFATDGKTIRAGLPGGEIVDLLRSPGQGELTISDDMFQPFESFKGTQVPSLWEPAPDLEVRRERLGGWPTIAGTRVPFDMIAQLVDFKTVQPEDVGHFYPGVSAAAARHAVEFDSELRAIGG